MERFVLLFAEMEFCGDGDEAALGQFGGFVELFADCSESVLYKMGIDIDRKDVPAL